MLQIHTSERADGLAAALARVLADPPDDPFTPDLVAVPTRGMERWLSQRLSASLGARAGQTDGICANIRFPPPGAVLGQALGLATGIDPDTDPWAVDRLAWHLLEVVEALIDERWLAPLAGHLRAAPTRRFARCSALARLFAEYGIRRPTMLQNWARGELGERGPSAWQPRLWVALREAIGIPSPAERLVDACARLRAEPDLIDLPQRLALFGLTRLPTSYVEALAALAEHRDVHLMLLHPSPALWAGDEGPHGQNRLLASWGREIAGLQQLLQDLPFVGERHPRADGAPQTLLAALQADIRANSQPPGPPLPGASDERLVLADQDRSIRIHACHGRARQVEVLREAILHRLAEDPTLEPRDVIVMCPDIETFAPLIEATFGVVADDEDGESDDRQERVDLRVRLADRSLRQTNPVLGVLGELLELPQGRLTASQVLDLADRAPVRRRFELDDDDLMQIRAWVAAAGIHWGLDGAGRSPYRLESLDLGTWEFGLRRLLLGVALGERGELFGQTLPLDDVQSGAIELAGRLSELVSRLGQALRALSGPHTAVGWGSALTAAADLLTATDERDAWQRRELDRIVADLIDQSASTPHIELALPEARTLLADRLAGRPTRANFRTGHLTICTLMPMRSVPHRVVCLLGLDDGSFPRQADHDGDNLLLADPRPGDRDPRAEDRQLLLDALMAASDALIITYTGNDERTNAHRPAAVPIGELLDAIEATASRTGASVLDQVVIHHPLQPFDPDNFVEGRLDGDTPWSFDPVALDGARAFSSPRAAPARFLPEPLSAIDDHVIALEDLVAFAERPVRAFLRQRLRIPTSAIEDETDDELPVVLDALAQWSIGQRLLDAVLSGATGQAATRVEVARGTLPPGELSRTVLAQVSPRIRPLVAAARTQLRPEQPRSLDANVVLDDGTRITGTVSGVRGDTLTSISYSRLNARHRIAAWVRLLALTAAHPEIPFQSITIGRGSRGTASVARVPALGRDSQRRAELARQELAALVALREEGLREPLPLPSLTAAAYATALIGGGDPEQAAISEWRSDWRGSGRNRFKFDGEDADPENRLAFGAEPPFDAMRGYALALWQPLLSRETVQST